MDAIYQLIEPLLDALVALRRETLAALLGVVFFIAMLTVVGWGSGSSCVVLALPWMLTGSLLIAYARAVREARRLLPLAMSAETRAKKLRQRPTWMPFSRARSVHHLAMAWEQAVKGEHEAAEAHLARVLEGELREDERRLFAAISLQRHLIDGNEARAAQSLALALPGRDALSEELAYVLVRWCWSDVPKLQIIERAARSLGGQLDELAFVAHVRCQQLEGALPATWPLPSLAARRLAQLEAYCDEEVPEEASAEGAPLAPYR